MPATIRTVTDADLAVLLTLNNDAVPAVNEIDADELASLVSQAEAVFVAERDGAPCGFVLTLRPGLDYESENYRWFSARGTDFLYVDRIVVGPTLRGEGVGRLLYDAVFDRARDLGASEVCCEVNLDPPNPGSSRFHRTLGFTRVGTQRTKGGSTTVEMLAAPVG